MQCSLCPVTPRTAGDSRVTVPHSLTRVHKPRADHWLDCERVGVEELGSRLRLSSVFKDNIVHCQGEKEKDKKLK